jgi:bifunctional non-homologous end joining protein LigD
MLLLRHHSQFIMLIVQEPLERRRQLLAEAMKRKAAPITLSESLKRKLRRAGSGRKGVCFEGIVAKRKNPIYESGKRSGAWVKYKVNRGQEFVIAEFR